MSGHMTIDVPRLERWIVRQSVQDRLAQHLDLTGAAVAGVDPNAVVVLGQQQPLVDRAG